MRRVSAVLNRVMCMKYTKVGVQCTLRSREWRNSCMPWFIVLTAHYSYEQAYVENVVSVHYTLRG
jgi:hypothetical protein